MFNCWIEIFPYHHHFSVNCIGWLFNLKQVKSFSLSLSLSQKFQIVFFFSFIELRHEDLNRFMWSSIVLVTLSSFSHSNSQADTDCQLKEKNEQNVCRMIHTLLFTLWNPNSGNWVCSISFYHWFGSLSLSLSLSFYIA